MSAVKFVSSRRGRRSQAFFLILLFFTWALKQCRESSASRGRKVSEEALELPPQRACRRLGLPQDLKKIPLSREAFTMGQEAPANFVMGILDVHPPFLLALPRVKADRIDRNSGLFRSAGNSEHTYKRASESNP